MKIGVLGLGFMGCTHLRGWAKLAGAEVAAVASDIPERLTGDLSGVQGNIGGPGERLDFSGMAKYTDPYEAVRNPELGAVDICLPTQLHADVAVAALEAGKHVLVEKPMALSGAEADRMIAAARASGRVLMAAQVVRFIPSYRVTTDLIRNGELGAIRGAVLRRRCAAPAWGGWLGDKRLSGGGVFDLLIHDLDYCLHAFGKPDAVSAVGHEDLARGIDWITAELFYPGYTAVVSGGWHHPKAYPFSMGYTVIGDCGTVEFDSAVGGPTWYGADGTSRALPTAEVDGYEDEIRYFFECCEEGKEPAFCRPEESAAAVKLAELLLNARAKNGEKTPCVL